MAGELRGLGRKGWLNSIRRVDSHVSSFEQDGRDSQQQCDPDYAAAMRHRKNRGHQDERE
tara:strand:- start:1290 stop:1469 length:180 start_codon:yes stop_codon:yes gene_type:complete